jgi:thiamine-monophosphate kinase
MMPGSNSGKKPPSSLGASRPAERALVDRLAMSLPGPPDGEVWIGDDAAVVRVAGPDLLISSDMAVAGVHGDLSLMSLADFGWKAVATAVSDIAAMGARPDHVLVSICGAAAPEVELLYEGIREACLAHGCSVVGGDLSSGRDLVVAVAVTGHVAQAGNVLPERRRPVLRSGASPGDVVMVTGPLGASAAGLRLLRSSAPSSLEQDPVSAKLVAAHRRPRALIDEGEAARVGGATAMMDVSDGLGIDLHRLARASQVGIEIDDVPVARGATLEEALGGGEDYELVLAAKDADELGESFRLAGLSPPLLIGRCTAAFGELRFQGDPLSDLGYEHRL